MAEQFTEQESKALSDLKAQIKQVKEEIRDVEDRRRAREKVKAEIAAKMRLRGPKVARDNKIRAALLEMAKIAKVYGMRFDAPPTPAGWRFTPARFASFKLHVDTPDGKTELVQIYTKHDGFEWD
jgi:hypothetical protein